MWTIEESETWTVDSTLTNLTKFSVFLGQIFTAISGNVKQEPISGLGSTKTAFFTVFFVSASWLIPAVFLPIQTLFPLGRCTENNSFTADIFVRAERGDAIVSNNKRMKLPQWIKTFCLFRMLNTYETSMLVHSSTTLWQILLRV